MNRTDRKQTDDLTIAFRCNQVVDCADDSDEEYCEMIQVPQSYRKAAPPYQNKHFKISVGIYVFKVLHLSEVDSVMEVQFQMELNWTDPRLLFLNLKDDSTINRVTHSKAARIWHPHLILLNTESREETKVNPQSAVKYIVISSNSCFQYEPGSFLKISKDGKFQTSPLHRLHNDLTYQGSENELILSHDYATKFICSFDLAHYPFDTQKCRMELKLDVRNSEGIAHVICHNNL